MIKVEAPTLHEAYSKAAGELSCSVVDLEINILQNSSSGFLGMFKKSAIIEVRRKGEKPIRQEREHKVHTPAPSASTEKIYASTETAVTPLSDEKRSERSRRNKNRRNKAKNKEILKSEEPTQLKQEASTPKIHKELPKTEIKKESSPLTPPVAREARKVPVHSHSEQSAPVVKCDIDKVIGEVGEQVRNLFKHSCFSLEVPVVSKYNEETILIEFCGEDAALLIGKEGYRYKALSYLLYNWINLKYGLNIRLEIAEFLKNQEEMIEKYLVPVVERIRNSGRGQTKILDGVLIKIALESLRSVFPDKYVGIKSGKEGGKFIVVNDFNRKNA